GHKCIDQIDYQLSIRRLRQRNHTRITQSAIIPLSAFRADMERHLVLVKHLPLFFKTLSQYNIKRNAFESTCKRTTNSNSNRSLASNKYSFRYLYNLRTVCKRWDFLFPV
ncbi:5476_t:CDS:2, partial [Acaulospora morrowiae]